MNKLLTFQNINQKCFRTQDKTCSLRKAGDVTQNATEVSSACDESC